MSSLNWEYTSFIDKLPACSGIYSINSLTENEILYIGKSVNIYQRVYSHSGFIKQLTIGGVTVIFGFILSKDISKLERDAISLYTPKYNSSKFKKARCPIGLEILKALDGRPVRWLSFKVEIPETDLSRKITRKLPFTQEEIQRINERLNVSIDINMEAI